MPVCTRGGYPIGTVLPAWNLICAHVYRFKMGWRKTGIWIVHAGLILLLLGELVSGLVQRDFQMRLDEEARRKNFSGEQPPGRARDHRHDGREL